MNARLSHRLSLAAMISYIIACASPLAMFLRAFGYVAGFSSRSLSPPWGVASWALIGGGVAGLAGGALCAIAARRLRLRARNYAAAAIATGFIGTPAGVIGVLWVDGLSSLLYYNPARQMSCQSNLKQIGLAALMYSQDYDDRLPLANRWNELTMPYIKNEYVYRCPEAAVEPPVPSYGFLRALSGASTKLVAAQDQTVMLFDSRPGVDVSGGMGSLPAPPRHKDGHNIGFMDGHVKFIQLEELPALVWKPTLIKPPRMFRLGPKNP